VKVTAQWRTPKSGGATPSWLRPLPVVLLLSVLTILVYVNSLPNEFVFDDLGLIVSNGAIRDIRNIPAILGAHGNVAYRPLRTASFAVDYFLFGLNPAGFRAVNIALHILNGALIFFLFRVLLRDPRPALLAAILFVVHPIQTDSVAYISGRRDILFTLFYLVGFACYVRYRETDRLRYVFLSGFAYLLSLFSKEMAISLPVLCVCYDMIRSIPVTTDKRPLAPWQAVVEAIRTAVRGNRVFYAVGAGGLLFLIWFFAFRVSPSLQRTMYGGGLGPTLLTSARIFVHYLKLLVFPLTLNADYSYNAFPVSRSLSDPRALIALAILGAVGWGIMRLLFFARWAAFGGLWFFITLLPVSQIIPHHEMVAEHYLYLPSAGVFLSASVLIQRSLARERRKVPIIAAFTLAVLLLGVRTVVRNRDWRDSRTLWTKTIQTAPESARAHTNVGEIAIRQGRFLEAYREFREALRIKPDDAIHHDNLGVVLLRHGLFDEAENEFRETLRILPSYQKARVNLGLVYLSRRQLDQAEEQFRTALASNGVTQVSRAEVLNNLGIVLALKRRGREAEQAFAEAVRLAPDYADARANLGKAYLENGMSKESITQLVEAVRLKASDARVHYMLGQAYYEQGQKEFAALTLARALSLNVDFPEARQLLDKIIREKGNGRGRRG
jgi:Flp pilus assembly protein TadD